MSNNTQLLDLITKTGAVSYSAPITRNVIGYSFTFEQLEQLASLLQANSLPDGQVKRAIYENLIIAISHAKIADDPFKFLSNQIEAMFNTEFSIRKRDAAAPKVNANSEQLFRKSPCESCAGYGCVKCGSTGYHLVEYRLSKPTINEGVVK